MFKRTHEERVARHEAKLLRNNNYVMQEDGDVYVSAGRYYISAELWNKRMNGLRFPNSNHKFSWVNFAHENRDVTGQAWPTVYAVCARCADRREISMMINLEQVNRDGWCVR